MGLSVQDFAAKIKAKYPEYRDVNDAELAQKVVAKYPEYKSKVDFGKSGSGAPNVAAAVSQGSEEIAKTISGQYQSPGSQFKKPWEYTADDFNSSPVGQFAQKQAPQMQQAMNDEAKITPIERVGKVAGQAVGGVGDVLGGIGNVVAGAAAQLNPWDIRTVTEKADQAMGGINQAVGGVGKTLTSPLAASPVLSKAASLPFEAAHDTLGSAVHEITGLDPNSEHGKAITDSFMNGVLLAAGVGKDVIKGVQSGDLSLKDAWEQVKQAPKNIKEMPGALSDAFGQAVDSFKSPAERVSTYKANVDKAVGQITQGKTKDIEAGKKALGEIDTSHMDKITYENLSKAAQDKIDAIKEAQDNTFKKSDVKYKLDNFEKEVKSGDTVVTVNPVKDALNQLQELYSKTNDPENLVRIQDLATKAEKYNLSLKDVNDLAREYGTEFGKKAFSKTGDPLTSVNAQAYENTRTAVKNAVRNEMPDNATKIMDEKMSDLINTKNSFDKMAEKVNALQQKIQERDLGEQVGRGVATVLNTASGGALKGFIERFLARGTGLKTLNALDLESFLSKNISNINKWSKMIDENPTQFIKESHSFSLDGLGKAAVGVAKTAVKSAPYAKQN